MKNPPLGAYAIVALLLVIATLLVIRKDPPAPVPVEAPPVAAEAAPETGTVDGGMGVSMAIGGGLTVGGDGIGMQIPGSGLDTNLDVVLDPGFDDDW